MTDMHYDQYGARGAGGYHPQPQLTDQIRDRGGEFVHDLGNAIRENPVSAALIGMGVLWLFMGGSRTSLFATGREVYDGFRSSAARVGSAGYDAVNRVGSAADRFGGSVSSGMSSGTRAAGDTLSDVGARAGEGLRQAGGAIGETMGEVQAQVGQVVSSAYDTVASTAGRVVDEVSDAAYAASRAAQRTASDLSRSGADLSRTVRDNIAEVFDRQPLVLGALGLAIGAALAGVVPNTETENRLMGETSDALKDAAKTLASEQVDKAKTMAGEAMQAVRREADAHGLTPEAASQAVSGAARKVSSLADTAAEALRDKLK